MANGSAITVTGLSEFISKAASLGQPNTLTRPVRAAAKDAANRLRMDVSTRISAEIDRPHPLFGDPFKVKERRGEEPGWIAETDEIAGALIRRLQLGRGPKSKIGLHLAPEAQDAYGNLRPGGIASLLAGHPRRFLVRGKGGRLSPGVWERMETGGLKPIAVQGKPGHWTRLKMDIRPDIRSASSQFRADALRGVSSLFR